MPDSFSYSLVGGQPVKINPLEVSASGTTYAPPGQAYNPVTCNIAGAMEEKSETVSANGTTEILPSEGKEGISKVDITVSVPPYMKNISAPYDADDGTYTFMAADEGGNIVGTTCVVSGGAVEVSLGDGSVEIDTSGDDPTIVWTPSVTIEGDIRAWYAENAIS